MRVIGTAGHVDHGKSTLVQALSGIDPDRLKEEKQRGMTIDLGFAWIDLPIGADEVETVGIIDVPGHIDFIKNMLAGVGSIDAAVLVIAADEGVMPQTREHLAILDLLGVTNGVVALTKADAVEDEEWLELVELDIVELLEGTQLADAPMIRISAQRGEGLDALRSALATTLADLTPRRNRARPRLPIDRIFSLSGFGTIVTGTLRDGYLTVGESVEILPSGQMARIRGLQSHNRPIEQSAPGSRLAINLSGVSAEILHRGDVVVKPGTLRPTVLLDVSFRLLADAPRALEHNLAVDFFSGATETPARVRVLGVEQIQPGAEGWLQLRLERPVVVAPGDRYILRQPSPSMTLGGGVVLSPHPRRRWKRFDFAVMERLETLARGAPDEILLQVLSRSPLSKREELLSQSGLDVDAASEAYAELTDAGALIDLNGALLSLDQWQRLLGQLSALLAEAHERAPLRRGMPRSEVRSRVDSAVGGKLTPRQFNVVLDRAQAAGLVEMDDSVVWQAGFAPALSTRQEAAVTRTLEAFAAAPYTPPNQGDTLKLLDDDEALLEMLVEQGRLIRIGGVLLRRSDYDAMCAAVVEFLQTHDQITLAETRDLFATSRKYAQALLEELDAQRITRRMDDVRVLRAG